MAGKAIREGLGLPGPFAFLKGGECMNIRKTTDAKSGRTRQSREDATTHVARVIIDTERAERQAKTNRLRIARLEKEAIDAAVAAAAAAEAPVRKTRASSRAKPS